jgi:hypothetical protein
MQQPSAQGIASLFRGNPAPLQQRIQQEQQAKPGLPQDLQKLMALNIVTNEKDAMAKQQALSQLAQMQGPQGKPPTVMETVQEQARQKMQAQQLQAQQQQQAMQAMAKQAGPGPVPEGTKFAEAQPQGIDELPVEFEMAGGGIVAFQSRGSVPEGENREEEERRKRESDKPLDAQAAADREAIASLLEALRGGSESAGRAIADVATMIPRGLVGAYDTAVVRPMRAAGVNAAYLSPKLTPEGANPESMTPFSDIARARETKQAAPQAKQAPVDNRAALNAADAAIRSAPPTPSAPISDLKALAEADTRKQQRPQISAPTMGSVQSAAPVEKSKAALMQESFLNKSPEDERIAAMERMKAMIKEPDTTQRDAMIKQLQAERDRQVGPQDSYGQLMEYLGQIAATPRGLSSFGAGAAGVRGVNALEEQRAQKRFELGSKIIEQEQGKINDSRAFAKDMFNVGEKEYDQILKTQFEAAKQITSNEMEALKIAKQETLKIMEMRQNAQIENRRIDAQATSASERLEDRRQQRMQQNAQFLDKMEATWASTYAKDPVYKGLSDQRKFIEMQRSIEKDEKKLSNLDAKLDDVNTKMIERGNSLRGGGGSSLPAAPPGAVREIKK